LQKLTGWVLRAKEMQGGKTLKKKNKRTAKGGAVGGEGPEETNRNITRPSGLPGGTCKISKTPQIVRNLKEEKLPVHIRRP